MHGNFAWECKSVNRGRRAELTEDTPCLSKVSIESPYSPQGHTEALIECSTEGCKINSTLVIQADLGHFSYRTHDTGFKGDHNMAICDVCEEDVGDSSKLKNHKRLHQKDVLVRYPGGDETIPRGPDGYFACYNVLCNYRTKDPRLLQVHGRGRRCGLRRGEAATATEGPSKTARNPTTTSAAAGAESSSARTASTMGGSGTLFDQVGLLYSPEINMIICKECRRVIKGEETISHIRKNHNRKDLGQDCLQAELSRLNVPKSMSEEAENLRNPTSELETLVSGLPVADGNQCTECWKTYRSTKGCRKHQRDEHDVQDDVTKIRKVRMQTFGLGVHMNFNFAIEDSAPQRGEASSSRSLAAAVQLATRGAMEANRMQMENGNNSRDWPPYFHYLSWHKTANDLEYSPDTLAEQLRCPKPKESKYARQLSKCVARMMDRIQKCIPVSDVLIRRRIKSPGSDVNPKPFSELQESGTREDYGTLLVNWIHFVLGAARGVHNFLEVNDRCGRAECLRLYEHVSSCEENEEAIARGADLLHALLRRIFLRTRRHNELEKDEICLRSIFLMAMARPKVLMARDVTPLISRFLYWIRGIVLLAIQEFNDGLVWEDDDDVDVVTAEKQEAEESRLLRFCKDTKPSPFCGLVQAKRIFHTYSTTEPVQDRLTFNDGDPRELLVEGLTLSLDDLALKVRLLKKELAVELEACLMLGMPCSGQIMQSLVRGAGMLDDLNETRQGYSFLEPESNFCFGVRNALIEHIYKNDKLRREFVKDGEGHSGTVWRPGAVRGWYKVTGAWLRKFMVLLHLVSGLPARATELAEYRYRNSQAGQRTLYISQGQAVFRPSYNKTNNGTGTVKDLCRFADPETTLLLVKYLAIVRLNEIMWCKETFGAECLPAYRAFIFVDRGQKITADVFGNELRKFFTKRLQRTVGVALWRHAAMHWGSLFCCGDRDPLKTIMHEQAGHTEETAGRVYARSADELLEVSAHSMSMFRKVSMAWHVMLGLIKDSTPVSARTRTTHANSRVTPQVPIPASGSGNGSGNGHDTGINSSSSSGHAHKECDVAVRRCLKLMKHPGFKSREQAEVVHRALQRLDDIFAILPTGGGKTLLYQLPALVEVTGITIIMCPFRALTRELMGRCAQVGLHAMQWCETLYDLDSCHLLFVAMEQVRSPNLQNAIAQQLARGRLSRFVIDECHVLISSRDWRQSMLDALQLRKHPVPLLLMSGSLPPAMQKQLEEDLCLDHPAVVRASCQRRNISYGVERLARDEMRPKLLWWLAKARDAQGLALVFCRSRDLSEELCIWLRDQPDSGNVSFYHSKVIDEVKEEREKAWESGGIDMMVATGAFGTGLDKRNVRVVVHFGEPWGALDLVQESGRAGRDGLKSWHRVLLANGSKRGWDGDVGGKEHKSPDQREDGGSIGDRGEETENGRSQREQDTQEEKTLGQILAAKKCRRMLIERYLDGDACDCAMSGSEPCDNCEDDGEGPVREQVAVPVMGEERAETEATHVDEPTEEPPPGEEPTREEHVDEVRMECSHSEFAWTINDNAVRHNSAGASVYRNVHSAASRVQETKECGMLIEEFTNELTPRHCLNCGSDLHDTRMCGRCCFYCMSKGHQRAKCTVPMIPWEAGKFRPMCYKCGLPRCLGGTELHTTNVGACCDSKGMDHYLPWAWLTWQQRGRCDKLLREAGVPQGMQDDESFSQWLGRSHTFMETNFVCLLVLLIKQRRERDRRRRYASIDPRPSM